MPAHQFLRRGHRILAVLFLLAVPPAMYASIRGEETSPFVYGPLFPLFLLMITGTYLLVRPWVLKGRADAEP